MDVIIAIGSNFFYTVTLPCTLWFFDKGKVGTDREDKVLFIDARHIYRQLDRAHRDFTGEMIRFIADVVRLYRGERVEKQRAARKAEEVVREGAAPDWNESFPKSQYRDVPGLCKVATVKEVEVQGWSLNPGCYVGMAERPPEDFDFVERLEELNCICRPGGRQKISFYTWQTRIGLLLSWSILKSRVNCFLQYTIAMPLREK